VTSPYGTASPYRAPAQKPPPYPRPARGFPPRPRDPQDPWMTVAAIAAELGVSKMTVYRLIHAGELAAHRIGRSFRVRTSALAAYLDGTLEVELEAEL